MRLCQLPIPVGILPPVFNSGNLKQQNKNNAAAVPGATLFVTSEADYNTWRITILILTISANNPLAPTASPATSPTNSNNKNELSGEAIAP